MLKKENKNLWFQYRVIGDYRAGPELDIRKHQNEEDDNDNVTWCEFFIDKKWFTQMPKDTHYLVSVIKESKDGVSADSFCIGYYKVLKESKKVLRDIFAYFHDCFPFVVTGEGWKEEGHYPGLPRGYLIHPDVKKFVQSQCLSDVCFGIIMDNKGHLLKEILYSPLYCL